MQKAPIKAVGHLINAVRGLEAVVGRMVENGDHTMLAVSRDIEEATRLIVEATNWPRVDR